MDTNDKTKCECYCHKKGAHCCDGGSGSCALCGEISDWAIKELVPLPLKTGGEKLSLNYKIKDFIQSVQGSTIDWQERRLKEFIRSLITHTTEQTTAQERERIVKLIKEKGLHLGYANDIISLINQDK